MKCPECGNSETFLLRVFEHTWTEVLVRPETRTVTPKSKEVELEDATGWDGVYCAECDTSMDDADDIGEEMDEIWTMYMDEMR